MTTAPDHFFPSVSTAEIPGERNPMKKLVAFVVPIADPAVPEDESPLSLELQQTGTVKVQAILSDTDAERVLSAIAACKVETPEKRFVTHLVERELAQAGPHANDLWQRIVSGVERKLISQVYADCDGVKTRAAARLGIDRNTLHKKLRQYDLIAEEVDPPVNNHVPTHSQSDRPGAIDHAEN